MKLANIPDPLIPMAVVNYAIANDYIVEEYGVDGNEFDAPLKMIHTCIKYAKERNCVEFCFKEIKSQYSFKTDMNVWRVTIFGLRPKIDDSII